jgi:uncharacterized membrane protein
MKDVNERLARLEKFARIMDYSFTIPFTKVRIGLDSIMGLLPVIGDTASLILSIVWIVRASRLGIPTSLIFKMLLRSVVDYLLSSIPLIGDISDIFYKANRQNWQSLYQYLKNKDSQIT